MVCETWNAYISNEFQRTVDTGDSTEKTHDTNWQALASCDINRQALTRIDTNAIDTPPHTPLPMPKPRMQTRICPVCGKSAKVLNLRRATCLSSNCNFDFCTQCFREWHYGYKCKNWSKNMVEKLLVAGTRQSKKRLKRL